MLLETTIALHFAQQDILINLVSNFNKSILILLKLNSSLLVIALGGLILLLVHGRQLRPVVGEHSLHAFTLAWR